MAQRVDWVTGTKSERPCLRGHDHSPVRLNRGLLVARPAAYVLSLFFSRPDFQNIRVIFRDIRTNLAHLWDFIFF